MRRCAPLAMFCLLVAFGLAPALAFEEVTLEGTLTCAKCSLKKADATGCQDVLVTEAEGAKTEYYLAANDVAKKNGHNCKGETPVTITGTVSEQDGRKWIAASKIEKGR